MNPIASFKIRMHNSQSDNQDLCGSNPQKMGSENPWPRPACHPAGRPGLAVLFIESQGAVFRKTVLKHTLLAQTWHAMLRLYCQDL
jgi:hypothetical protein